MNIQSINQNSNRQPNFGMQFGYQTREAREVAKKFVKLLTTEQSTELTALVRQAKASDSRINVKSFSSDSLSFSEDSVAGQHASVEFSKLEEGYQALVGFFKNLHKPTPNKEDSAAALIGELGAY